MALYRRKGTVQAINPEDSERNWRGFGACFRSSSPSFSSSSSSSLALYSLVGFWASATGITLAYVHTYRYGKSAPSSSKRGISSAGGCSTREKSIHKVSWLFLYIVFYFIMRTSASISAGELAGEPTISFNNPSSIHNLVFSQIFVIFIDHSHVHTNKHTHTCEYLFLSCPSRLWNLAEIYESFQQKCVLIQHIIDIWKLTSRTWLFMSIFVEILTLAGTNVFSILTSPTREEKRPRYSADSSWVSAM